MNFTYLSIAGFRSFRQSQTVRLDGAPGLIFVTGDNQVEPELGANGAGKSTLFEALQWVLFGRTSRNLRASDIANWTDDAVDCQISLGLDGHVVSRTWRPNTLKVDGEEVGQQRITELLGLDEDAFLHAVYHAQFVSHFADLGPTAQLGLFSEVLRLQVWEKAAEEANVIAKRHSSELAEVRQRVAGLLGEWRQATQELEVLEQKEVDWWRDYIAEQRGYWKALRQAEEELAEAERAAATLDRSKEKELHAAEMSLAERRGDIKVHQQILAKLQGLAGRCPTCFQLVDKRILEEPRRALQSTLVRLAADQVTVSKRAERLRTSWLAVMERHRQEEERREKARVAWRTAAERCSAHADSECPYDTERLRTRLELLEQRLASTRRDEGDAAWTIEAHEFWVKAFREIRLSVVQQALIQFESTTNNALAALGLVDWRIEYDVQSETKGGKLVRGFVTYIHSPYNKGPVPFAAWSGGESQRLRLAISLGLSDLIQDFCGTHSNVEIFDEPTNWLSGEGLEGLLQVLAERARERKIRIFLADHKSLGYSFDGIVMVTKDDMGSRVVESV